MDLVSIVVEDRLDCLSQVNVSFLLVAVFAGDIYGVSSVIFMCCLMDVLTHYVAVIQLLAAMSRLFMRREVITLSLVLYTPCPQSALNAHNHLIMRTNTFTHRHHTGICICMHACRHASMHACMHACKHIYTCMHARTHACTHAHSHAYTYIHTYMHACMHAHS